MCEQYVARSAEPFRIDELWPFTGRLEHFGMAGFGWGAAWLTAEGTIETYRDVRSFADEVRECTNAVALQECYRPQYRLLAFIPEQGRHDPHSEHTRGRRRSIDKDVLNGAAIQCGNIDPVVYDPH